MSRRYCMFCGADFRMYTHVEGEKVAGFSLRGMNMCCPSYVNWWLVNKSRLTFENQYKVRKELGYV